MFGHRPNGSDSRFSRALILVSILFLIPIALLATMVVQQSRKDIVFVSREIEGIDYSRSVWPVLSDLLASRGDRVDVMRRWDAIRDAGEVGDADMNTLEARRALSRAMSGGGDAATAAGEILQAAAALITKIDDGSNLTLDPDLESFYLMDSATVKLPAFAIQTALLLDVDADRPEAAPSLEARIGAARAVERFRVTFSAFQNSVDSVGRTSGAPHPMIMAARARIDALSGDLMQRVGRIATDHTTEPPSDAVRPGRDFARAFDQYWEAATSELRRVLETRHKQLVAAEWVKLATVAAVCLAALLVVGFMAFSANRNIDRIIRSFRRS